MIRYFLRNVNFKKHYLWKKPELPAKNSGHKFVYAFEDAYFWLDTGLSMCYTDIHTNKLGKSD